MSNFKFLNVNTGKTDSDIPSPLNTSSNFKFLNVNTGKSDSEIPSPLNTSSTNLTDLQSPFTSLSSVTSNSFNNSSLSNTPYSFIPTPTSTSTSTSRASSVVPNKLGLSVFTEEENEEEEKILCFDRENEEKYIENRDNFNKKISLIKEQCIQPPEKNIISKTQNSIIYNHRNPNILIKESKLMRQTNNFLKYIPENVKIQCAPANKLIEKSLDEAEINEYYSNTLGSLYQEHFMIIQHLNTCKYKTDDDYSVFFRMENIQGVSFDNFFLEETNPEIVDDILFKLILQITYVLIHSNMLGLYHNDIKLNNIIIYKTDKPEITYKQIKEIQLQILSPNYFFKLIDYSDVVIINEQNPNEIKLFDIIEFISSIQSKEFKKIDSTKLIKSIQLIKIIRSHLGSQFFGEGDINFGNKRTKFEEGWRVFSREEIILASVKVRKETILRLFAEIKSVFSQENIKISFIQSAGTKYKNKYLQLKKLSATIF